MLKLRPLNLLFSLLVELLLLLRGQTGNQHLDLGCDFLDPRVGHFELLLVHLRVRFVALHVFDSLFKRDRQ